LDSWASIQMSKIPLEYYAGANDFGFTAVNETDLVDPFISEVNSNNDAKLKSKLQQLEQMILPLLVNLTKNPEKEYIQWPNRVEKIEQQIEKILAITRSE
jgi:hypothetical protein